MPKAPHTHGGTRTAAREIYKDAYQAVRPQRVDDRASQLRKSRAMTRDRTSTSSNRSETRREETPRNHRHLQILGHHHANKKEARRRQRGGETTLRQTCPWPKPQAQCAFKDSMVHGILQFTLRIAFRCVLHRYGSQDIRC